MYKIKIFSRVKSDIKKLDKQIQRKIEEQYFTNIERDPFKATPLAYEFKGLWSYHFSYGRSQYRIIYEIDQGERLVLVIMIGKREGIYKALRKRVKNG